MSEEPLYWPAGRPISTCVYCITQSEDVCKDSFQAGQCERRIKAPGAPLAAPKAKPPKDQFFLAAAELCQSLQKLVEIEIQAIEKKP